MGWHQGAVFYPVDSRKEPIRFAPKLNMPDEQNIRELWADFLGAIRSGGRPVSDIEEIYRSTNCSLLGMLSYKLGRGIQWDGQKEEIVGDPEANKLRRRDYRGTWKYPEVA